MNNRNLNVALLVSIGAIVLVVGCDANRATQYAPFSIAPGAARGGECRVTDDEATKTRTLSGACSQTRVAELPELGPGWKIRGDFTPPSGRPLKISRVVVPGSCSANCPTYWTQPDSSYLSATAPISVGPYTWVYNTYPQAIHPIGYPYSDSTLTVTLDEYSKTGPVANHTAGLEGMWAVWASPPAVESMYPDVIYVNNSSQYTVRPSVGMKLSRPVTILGFEMEPNNFYPTSSTITYYSAGSPIGSVSVSFPDTNFVSDGAGKAQLIAINSPVPFDSVVIGNPDDQGFAIANLRYALAADALTLNCDNTNPTRGDTITCTASLTSGAPLTDIMWWRFYPSNASLADPLGYIDRANVTGNMTTWSGTVVTPGQVEVYRLSGDTKRVTITVASRSWDSTRLKPLLLPPNRWQDGRKPRGSGLRNGFTDPVVTANGTPPGADALGETTTGIDSLESISVPTYFPRINDNGPNQGLSYTKALPGRIWAESSVNEQALAINSVWYGYQPDLALDPYCGKPYWTGFRDRVAQHEGVSDTTYEWSHIRGQRRGWTQMWVQRLDTLVLPVPVTIDSVKNWADSAKVRADYKGYASAHGKEPGSVDTGTISCKFMY